MSVHSTPNSIDYTTIYNVDSSRQKCYNRSYINYTEYTRVSTIVHVHVYNAGLALGGILSIYVRLETIDQLCVYGYKLPQIIPVIDHKR